MKPSTVAPVWPIPALDSLRGIAALSVFVHHFLQQFSPVGTHSPFQNLGGFGVTIFFILSGFLIHGGSIREFSKSGSVNWKNYLRKRFFRIYPPFVVALAICAICGLYAQSNLISHPTWGDIVRRLTLQYMSKDGVNLVFWTVVVECHFYIIYPLLWLGMRKWGAATALSTVILSSIAFFVGWTVLTSAGALRVIGQQSAPALIWQWCAGALLAEFYLSSAGSRFKTLLRRPWLLPLCLGLCFAGAFIPKFALRLQYERFIMPAACLGVVAVLVFALATLRFKPTEWLGDISYSIYLLHPLPLLFVLYNGPDSLVAKFMIATGLTILLAAISFYLVERPSMRFGREGAIRNLPKGDAVPLGSNL